jgi:hypothetical protein
MALKVQLDLPFVTRGIPINLVAVLAEAELGECLHVHKTVPASVAIHHFIDEATDVRRSYTELHP